MTQSTSDAHLKTIQDDSETAHFELLTLLDCCKGLAILWIFLIHCKGGWFGWQGVHLFIVLSGFGLTYSCLKRQQTVDWKQWYIKRATRLLPTYWLVCLFGFLLFLVTQASGVDATKTSTFNPWILLFFNISLLRNFFNPISENSPNVSLWFVPLIAQFYLVFPWLYCRLTTIKTLRGWVLIPLGLVLSEFLYRAVAIYWLDGMPVAYLHGFLNHWVMAVEPLDRLKDTLTLPFQEAAPFQFLPSRLAEFLLGMIGAIALKYYNQAFSRCILNQWLGVVGIGIWLVGNALLYAGLLGWVFADFTIAIGLTIWMLNFAHALRLHSPQLFRMLSRMSPWSYYIFLSHYLFIYWFETVGLAFAKSAGVSDLLILVIGFSFITATTWISSWGLMKFDQSKLSQLIIQNTVARLLH
ncbi:acyltransferase [Oculatella sp. LEGE 06141]|uniref:acyltransferase family protein n=1 Tax=Oculatella sp. LEGE 06141 TaxID=1828648 RepID=UPI00187F0365|nr:acyltransferase [Oculatella sp. LEGE 06141]MBE9178830.1 acyltransferase [Oculatella sp. LEGE 06141]